MPAIGMPSTPGMLVSPQISLEERTSGIIEGGTFSDVWVLSGANGLAGTPNWTKLAPSGNPARGQYGASAVYDQTNNRLIIFGGDSGTTGKGTNGVSVLLNANGQGESPAWGTLQVSSSGDLPTARAFQSAVYDSATNQMVVFGGNDSEGLAYNDVWVLSNANGRGGAAGWTKLQPTGPSGILPTPRDCQTAVYDSTTNRMIIFGGSNYDDAWFNGVWVLTDANGT